MDKYIAMIKAAKSKQEIMDATYEAFKDTTITGKQHDLLTDLGVYKEAVINNKLPHQLKECASVLKIPAKYINLIK